MTTKPEVFIIESLHPRDERKKHSEGQVILSILAQSGKKCIYYYIRTEKELCRVVEEFRRSNYRYLHLSCHGTRTRLYATYDTIKFDRLADILHTRIRNRRLFLPACQLTNGHIARKLFSQSPPTCSSLLGPASSPGFAQASIFWTSFYHVMFAADKTAMKHRTVLSKAQALARIYELPLNFFAWNTDDPRGYEHQFIDPFDEATA